MLLFFLIIKFYFLIRAVIAQIFNSITELVITVGILGKETKAKIAIHPLIVDDKKRKCSI